MKKMLILGLFVGLVFGAQIDTQLKKCTGCHGQNFEKKALGKSEVVKDMTKEEIVTTMKGYKEGKLNKYGMGMIMKSQASNLSEDEINEMAGRISGK